MKKIYLICLGYCLITSLTFAQEQVHVVTKTIEKQLDYLNGEKLEIQAEKASIKIGTWDKKYIGLKIKLISKNKKKETAQTELNLLKYEAVKTNTGYFIRNYFEATDKFIRVKGSLLTEFDLMVPQGCNIILTNNYGKLTVNKLDAILKAQLKFVDCDITRGDGDYTIISSFGSIYLNGFNGKLSTNLERSNLELINFEGTAKLESTYGELNIEGGSFKGLNITGNRSKISFSTPLLESYNYEVKTTFSTLRVPNDIVSNIILKNENQNLVKDFKANNPKIILSTTYGSIDIKQVFSASNK